MRSWLIKSEPDVYSLADLETDGTEIWDGVRNYQARNFLREMEVGDRLFFYHSTGHRGFSHRDPSRPRRPDPI
jgi:predicted RNA-binding protein with PUA-like domain